MDRDAGNRRRRIRGIAEDTVRKIDSMPIVLPESGSIAGRTEFSAYDGPEELRLHGHKPFYGTDNIHFSMDLAYLDLGIDELLRRASMAAEHAADEDRRAYAGGVRDTWQAISRHIMAHAEMAEARGGGLPAAIAVNCRHIARAKPDTFEQSLQLFWFVWVIRSDLSHIHFDDPGYYMATLGRWDQHYYPFMKRDLELGRITREEASELVKEVFRKMNRIGIGDTLKNMMLGGQDEFGHDQTNELSSMCIDAVLETGLAEPHLNVRLHASTDGEFQSKAFRLALMGQGQGEVFNDEAIIPRLVAKGIPQPIACNYACDGCEEIIIDRKGAILFREIEALKILELAYFDGEENPHRGNRKVRRWSKDLDSREIHTELVTGHRSGDMRKAASWDEAYSMFLDQYRFQVGKVLEFMDGEIRFYRDECIASMVLAGGYVECIDSGADPYRDVIKYMFFQVQSGSLPPLADALAAIRRVVFEEGAVSMECLIDALARNFEGDEALRRRLLAAPKFGNDDDNVDLLAAELAHVFCSWISDRPTSEYGYLWPAIYSIFFMDHAAITGATSDGRRCGDPLAVHFSPVPGRATLGPTAALLSAAKTDLREGLAGSPVFLTVSRSLIPLDGEGLRLVSALIRSAIELNLPILSFAINDIAVMRHAVECPGEHEDLIVRIWGFNARFIDLTPEMQNHVIDRTIGQAS